MNSKMDKLVQKIVSSRLAQFAGGELDDRSVDSVLPTENPFSPDAATLYVPSGAEDTLASLLVWSEHKVVLVTGCAGCGKTTLVEYVLGPHLRQHEPLFLEKTEQARIVGRTVSGDRDARSIIGAIDSQLSSTASDNPSGQALLFVDGVDETPLIVRPALLDACREFLRVHSQAKMVMTSRLYSFGSWNSEHEAFPGYSFAKLDLSASPLDQEPVVQLYAGEDPPAELVTVAQCVNAELIAKLKGHPEGVYDMSPRAFEELIAEILASYGWQIHLTAETRDGGYDIFAISKDISGASTSWVVECKRYSRERKVGVDIARSLYAVKGDLRVANAMIATTSFFTSGVVDFKNSRYDFHLRDFRSLVDWLQQYRPTPDGRLYLREDGAVMRDRSR